MKHSGKLLSTFLVLTCSASILLSGCGNQANTPGTVPAASSAPGSSENANLTTPVPGNSVTETQTITTPAADGTSPADTSSAPAAPANTTPAAVTPDTTPAATAPAVGDDVAAVPSINPPFAEDAAALPNDAIPWGYASNDRDELNRPNGSLYFQRLYGSYADFIGPKTKTIYLTMDEGYEAGFTPKILDTLKEKNVKATFFLTKQFFDSDPDLIQRMIDEGHVIGNHTCAHPAGGIQQLGIEGETQDIMKLHNLVKDKFGYDMKLFRYPEGVFSQQSLKVVDSLGYRSVFWSFAHKDWDTDNQPDPTASLQKCLNELHPGAIYLLHAVSGTNTEILGNFIDGARAQGYEFGQFSMN